jgi:hypothetical protein
MRPKRMLRRHFDRRRIRVIIASRKQLEDIKEMLKGYKKVLNVGCGG